MQVQVTLNLADPKQQAAFDALRSAHTGATVTAVTAAAPAPAATVEIAKKRPGRPTKEEVAAREAAKAATTNGVDDDEFGDDVDEEGEESEDGEETEDDTIEDDDDLKKKVQVAMRKFATAKGEKGREAAIKVLKKFAPGIKDVKKSQVDDLLKKLKVA